MFFFCIFFFELDVQIFNLLENALIGQGKIRSIGVGIFSVLQRCSRCWVKGLGPT